MKGIAERISAGIRRLRTGARKRVLDTLAQGETAGVDLGRSTGLGSHRLYPALMRLEEEGVIESRWAEGPKPRRRLYRLAA